MTARLTPAGPSSASPARGIAVLVALSIALLVAACGAAAVSPAPPASPSGTPRADAVAPSSTPWPGGVVEAVMILAKADVEIQAAGGDLGVAAHEEDLEGMWGAADGLATLIERLQGQVPRIAEYEETAPAAAAYERAFPEMLAGARALRDAITAEDAAGIAAGSQQLAAGLEQYREARRLIGPLADRAILMQRILFR